MADSPVPPPNPSDDLTPEDSNPLGLQHPLSAPKPLGQQVPNLQFMRPLGANPLGILDPSIFFRGELASPYSALTEPYNSSPFFQPSRPSEATPSNFKAADSPISTSVPASVQRQASKTPEFPPVESSAPALEALEQSFAADGTLQRSPQTPTPTSPQVPAPLQASTSAQEPSPVDEVVDTPKNLSPGLIQRSPETSSSSTPSSAPKSAANSPIQNLNPPSALTDYPALGSPSRIRPSQDTSIADSVSLGRNLSSESILQPSPLDQSLEPSPQTTPSDQAVTPTPDDSITGIEPLAASPPSNIQRQAVDHPGTLPETAATDLSRPNIPSELPEATEPVSARPFHPGSFWSAAVERIEGAPPSPAASPNTPIQRQPDLPSAGVSSSSSPSPVEAASPGTSATTPNPQPTVFSNAADSSSTPNSSSTPIQRQADVSSAGASASSLSPSSGDAPNTVASASTAEPTATRQQPADISNTVVSPNTSLQRQADSSGFTTSTVPTQQPSDVPISSEDLSFQPIQQQPDSTLVPLPETSSSTPSNLIQRQTDDIDPADSSHQDPQVQIENFSTTDATSTPIQRQVESFAFEAQASAPNPNPAEPSTPSDNIRLTPIQQSVEGSVSPDLSNAVDTPNIPLQRQADGTAVRDSVSTTLQPQTGDSASVDSARAPLPQQAGGSVAQNAAVTPGIQRQPDVPIPSDEPGSKPTQATEGATPNPPILVTEPSVTPIQRQTDRADAIDSASTLQQQVEASSSEAAATTPLQTQTQGSATEGVAPSAIQRQGDTSQLSGSASVPADQPPVGSSIPTIPDSSNSHPASIQRQAEPAGIGNSMSPPMPERASDTRLGDATISPLQQPVDATSPVDLASQPTIQRQVEAAATPLGDFSASSVHPPVEGATPTDLPSTEASISPLNQGQVDVASAEDSGSLPIQRQADTSVPPEASGLISAQRQADDSTIGDSTSGEPIVSPPIQRQIQDSGSEATPTSPIQRQISDSDAADFPINPLQQPADLTAAIDSSSPRSQDSADPAILPGDPGFPSVQRQTESSTPPSGDFTSPLTHPQGDSDTQALAASIAFEQQMPALQPSEAAAAMPSPQQKGESSSPDFVTSPEATITPIQRQAEIAGFGESATPSTQPQVNPSPPWAGDTTPSQMQRQVDVFAVEESASPFLQQQADNSFSLEADGVTPIQRQTDVPPLTDFIASPEVTINSTQQQSENPGSAELADPSIQRQVDTPISTGVSDLAPNQQPDGSSLDGSPLLPSVADAASLDSPGTLIQHPGHSAGVGDTATPSVQRQVIDSPGNNAPPTSIQTQTDGFDPGSSVSPPLQRSVEPITPENSDVTLAQGSGGMATPATSSSAESTQPLIPTQPLIQRQTDVSAAEDASLPPIQQAVDGSSPSDWGSPRMQRQTDPLQTSTAGSGEAVSPIASDYSTQTDSSVTPDIATRRDVIQRQGEEGGSSTASESRDPDATSFFDASDTLGSATSIGSTSPVDATTPLTSPSILQRQPHSALPEAVPSEMVASDSSLQSASAEFLPSELASVEQAIPSSEAVFPTSSREGEPVVNDLRSQVTAPSSTPLSPTADIDPSSAVPSIQAFRDPDSALTDTVQPQADSVVDGSPDRVTAPDNLEEDTVTALPSVLQDLSVIRPLSTRSPSHTSPQGSSPPASNTVMRSPQGSLSEPPVAPGYSALPMKPPAPTALDHVLNTINAVTSAAKPTISSNGGSSHTLVQASSAQSSATTSPPARTAHPGTEWSSIEELLRVTSPANSSASSKVTSVSRSSESKGFSNLQPFAAEHTLLQAKFDKVQRQLLAWQGSPPTIQRDPGDPPLPTSVAPTSQPQPAGTDQGNGASLAALDKLVREVSGLLQQRLALEHERRGSRRL